MTFISWQSSLPTHRLLPGILPSVPFPYQGVCTSKGIPLWRLPPEETSPVRPCLRVDQLVPTFRDAPERQLQLREEQRR